MSHKIRKSSALFAIIIISLILTSSLTAVIAGGDGPNENISIQKSYSPNDPSVQLYTENSTTKYTTNGWIILNTSYSGITLQNDKIRSANLSGVPSGTIFNITGSPNSGYVFTGWEGAVNSSQRSLNIPIVNNTVEAAVFSKAHSYNVTFTESGLLSGTKWYINITGQNSFSSTSTTITAPLPNGNYTYSIASSNKQYSPSPSSGSFSVAGTFLSQTVTFFLVTYPISFTETGLPTGTYWSVTLSGPGFSAPYTISTTSSSMIFNGQNGTYSFMVGVGYGVVYTPFPSSGNITVFGSAVTQPILFTSEHYSVTFTETGLPSGTKWYLNITEQPSLSSVYASITTSLQNGSYTYSIASPNKTYFPSPSSGSFSVKGSAVFETVTFSTGPYSVTFTETGLPTNDTWNVTLNTIEKSSRSSSIVFNEANGSYSYIVGTTSGYAPTPSTGTLSVSGSAVTRSIAFSVETYQVGFYETGLPSGTKWYVNITGQASLSTSSRSVETFLSNGNYTFTVSSSNKQYYSYASGQFFTVSGAGPALQVPFVLIAYSATFIESGLSSGTSWTVSFAGTSQSSTTTTDVFIVGNGTYAYNIESVSGYNSSPSTGSITVDGANLSQTITFTKVVAKTYAVTFAEEGLTAGTSWNVTLGDISQSSVDATNSFQEANGSYSYSVGNVSGYTVLPYSGTVKVNGEDLNVNISFTKVTFKTYAITFTEAGLPTGTSWSVALNGSAQSSISSSIVFNDPNGTYSFTVGSVSGYAATPSSGSLMLSGYAVTESITFSPKTYPVTFTESGLPSGREWYINITNQAPIESTTTTITTSLPNDSYSYSVGSNSGYVPSPASGSFTVDGSSVTIPVTFLTKTQYVNSSIGDVVYSISLIENQTVTGFSTFSADNMTVYGTWATYDPTDSLVYVSLVAGVGNSSPRSYLYAINSSTNQIVKSSVINCPDFVFIVYDPVNGYIYGWNGTYPSDEVEVYNSSNFEFVEQIYGGGGWGPDIVYDPDNGNVYIGSSGSIIEIDSITNQQTDLKFKFPSPGYSSSIYMTYDSSNKCIYDSNNYEIRVLDTLNNTFVNYISMPGSTFGHMAFDPANNKMYVMKFNETDGITLAIIGNDSHNITENVTLPLGMLGNYIDTSIIYNPVNENLYVENYEYNLLEINSTDNSVIGYLNLSNWPLQETDGLLYDPANGYIYLMIYGEGLYAVSSASTYSIKFTETGIPGEPLWTIDIQNFQYYESGTSVYIKLPNGTYDYTISSLNSQYFPVQSGGEFTVRGEAIAMVVAFAPTNATTFDVIFTESGLPLGTSWSVTLNGNTLSSTASTISFTEPNGTYTYSIGTVPGWSHTPNSASITIDGQEKSISIAYIRTSYDVTFEETGLQADAVWYLNLTGYNSSGPIHDSTFSVYLVNGTYDYVVSQILNYFVSNGSFIVNGESTVVEIGYEKFASIEIDLQPSTANLLINGNGIRTENGIFQEYVKEGYYFINATEAGYTTYSNLVYLSWNETYWQNITLKQIDEYGYLAGTVIPGNATILANGIPVPVSNGFFNTSLTPGIYYISVTAKGYEGYVTMISVPLNETASLEIVLKTTSTSVTVSGHVVPFNSSVTVNGLVAYVNSTGFYQVYVPSGNVTVSAYDNGYYSYSVTLNLQSSREIDITLAKETQVTSVKGENGTIASGYNVTISSITTEKGIITVSYNTTTSGTLVVLLPEIEILSATVADLLNSTVFIDGVQYHNFTITISSNGSAILTVYSLSGDPTLYWKYSPAGSVPSYYTVEITESGLPEGTGWYLNLTNGQVFHSSSSTITFQELNGTYSYSIASVTGYNGTPSSGSLTVNGHSVNQAITFTQVINKGYFIGTIMPLNASININGVLYQAVSGQFNISLSPGTYEVKVSAPGYTTYTTNITISSSSLSKLPIQNLTKVTKPSLFPFLYFILIAVVVIAAIVAAVVTTLSKSRRKRL